MDLNNKDNKKDINIQINYFLTGFVCLKMADETIDNKSLAVFQGKGIRRTWFNDEWWFVAVDIIEVLTDSVNSTDYLKKLRKRDLELGSYIGTNCPRVEIAAAAKKQKL